MTKREETLEMQLLYEDEGLTIQQIADRYGISKQSVSQRFAAMKVAVVRPVRPPKCSQTAPRDKLEVLYSYMRLPMRRIAEELSTSLYAIDRALEFYKIPKRKSLRLNGKYIDLIRELKAGECVEMECHSKTPHNLLHRSAKRAGVKVSVRKLGRGKFAVTGKT